MVWVILLLVLLGIVYIPLITNNLIKIIRFKFIGNTYAYVAVAFLVCLAFSLYVNFNPLPVTVTTIQIIDGVEHSVITTTVKTVNPFLAIVASLFDALRMMVVAFDRTVVTAYYNAGGYNSAFAIGYILSSIFAVLFTSISVVLFTFKSFGAKITNAFRRLSFKNDLIYIFSDCKSEYAPILGESLKKRGKIVIMYVTRSSLKTQEGNEYHDMLVNKKLDVRAENFTMEMCRVIVRHFSKRRKVQVYSLLSNDDSSINLADNFQGALFKNRHFLELKQDNYELNERDIHYLKNFKIFINYYEHDLDLNNNYSGKSFHIINTFSISDIISTEFIIHNQITNFININELSNKDNKHFHVTFLGFGNINRRIMEKMTYSYQLFGDNINKINYHILDRNSDELASYYIQNEYTQHNTNKGLLKTPHLYDVSSGCNGKSLSEFETLDDYIGEENKKDNRFQKDGFEAFIIAVNNINENIKVATLLRKALLKNVNKEKLCKTAIFVRISNQDIASNFKRDNIENKHSFILDQKDFNDEYFNNENRILIPIIIFGEDTLISDYIDRDYDILAHLGIASQKAYYNADYLKAMQIWLQSKKSEVITNLASIYSLGTKLALLGYKLDSDYNLQDMDNHLVNMNDFVNDIEKQFKECGFPEKYDLSNPVIRLASLEHNRWVASSYQIFNYSLLPLEDFIKNNTVDGKFIKKPQWTKENNVRHICMVTNESLMALREKIIELNPELEKAANDLTFYTDIQAIKDVCLAIKDIKR